MKRFVSFALLLLLSVGLLVLVGCQSKEVTSAKVYIQQDDWDKAIEQLEVAVETFPNDAEAHMLLGRGYGKKNNYPKMMDHFKASLAAGSNFEKDINHEIAYYWTNEFNAGVKSFNANALDKAIEQFNTCILLDSTRKDSYKNLASCYQRNNDTASAVSLLEVYLTKHPKDVESMLRLHDMYVTTEEYDKSINLLKKAKELDPDNVDILSAMAITYDMKGDREQAFEVYHNAIEKNPNNVDLLFNLGRLYFMRDDFENAIKYFDRVIANDPDDFESNLNVGNAYLSKAEKMDKALRAEEEKAGKELSDKRADVKSIYLKAVPYLEKALEIKPEQAGVWNNLGVAYIRSDQMDKGKEAFNKADELNKSEK